MMKMTQERTRRLAEKRPLFDEPMAATIYYILQNYWDMPTIHT